MSSCLRKWHIETSHVYVHSNLNSLTLGSARKTPLRDPSKSASDCHVNVTRPVQVGLPKSDFQCWDLKALGLLQKSIRHFQSGLAPLFSTVHNQAKKSPLNRHTRPPRDWSWQWQSLASLCLWRGCQWLSRTLGECVCVCVSRRGSRYACRSVWLLPVHRGLVTSPECWCLPHAFTRRRHGSHSDFQPRERVTGLHTHTQICFRSLFFPQVSGAHSQVVVIELNISWQKPLFLWASVWQVCVSRKGGQWCSH